MFCKICGASIVDGAKFCGSCGASVAANSAAESVSAPPAQTEFLNAAPVNPAPVESTPVNTAPVETPPVNTAPKYEAPVYTAPVESAPVNVAPVNTTPVESAPVNVAPANTAPVNFVPVNNAPISVVPVNVNNAQPVQDAQPQYAQGGVATATQQVATQSPQKEKNKKVVGIVIGCAALTILVIIGIILAIALGGNNDTPPPPVESGFVQEDAEAFFNEMMESHVDDSYTYVYATSIHDIKANKLCYLCDEVGLMYSWTGYSETLPESSLNVNDVMTSDEHSTLVSSGAQTWTVFKSADVQSALDKLYGKDTYKVKDLVSDTALITSSGYLFYPEENVDPSNVYYYGKVVDCTKEGEDYVIKAYVLKCDNNAETIYDEAIGTSVGGGTVTPNPDVNFDSVVAGIGINTSVMSTITFTIGNNNGEAYLKSAVKPQGGAVGGGVVKGTTAPATPSVDGTVTYTSTYYMYVAADGGLNMRSLPSKSSSRILNIPDNSTIVVHGYSSIYTGWVYIEYGGYYGWVASDYLVSCPSTNYSNVSGYYYVNASPTLNIRSGPGKSYGVIGSIPDGACVYVQKCNQSGSWAYVTYGGVTGWVSTSYLW